MELPFEVIVNITNYLKYDDKYRYGRSIKLFHLLNKFFVKRVYCYDDKKISINTIFMSKYHESNNVLGTTFQFQFHENDSEFSNLRYCCSKFIPNKFFSKRLKFLIIGKAYPSPLSKSVRYLRIDNYENPSSNVNLDNLKWLKINNYQQISSNVKITSNKLTHLELGKNMQINTTISLPSLKYLRIHYDDLNYRLDLDHLILLNPPTIIY